MSFNLYVAIPCLKTQEMKGSLEDTIYIAKVSQIERYDWVTETAKRRQFLAQGMEGVGNHCYHEKEEED